MSKRDLVLLQPLLGASPFPPPAWHILHIPVNSHTTATETAIGPPVLIMPSDSSKFKWGICSVKVLSNISLLCNLVWRQYPLQVEYKSKD
jgi:hypothetical protein